MLVPTANVMRTRARKLLVALFWRVPTRAYGVSSILCLTASVVCWGLLLAVADKPEDWIGAIGGFGAFLISGIAAVIAWLAKDESKRAADAAEGSHQITELQEERRKYGWRIEPHPRRDRHILRNMGTLTATDVKFRNQSKFFILQFASKGDDPVDIAPGEARAFDLLHSFSSTGIEIQIDWLPEGESNRHHWTEVTSQNGSIEESNRREDQHREDRFRSADKVDERARESRDLILQLGDAYSDWIENPEDAKTKLRVQLLTAALPPSMAREIGFEVDVLRDAWGRGWYPLENHVAQEDAHLLDGVIPQVELVWNMHQLTDHYVQYANEGRDQIQEPTISWALRGYVERVRERQSGERKTRWTAAEQAKLDARFAGARGEADFEPSGSEASSTDQFEPDAGPAS